METYFATLGYGGFTFNISKAGREIDIQARHITENRRLFAECKATGRPIGGAPLNKFAGALEVERAKEPAKTVAGYFVSLSGFTGTALEQERDAGPRIVTVNGDEILKRLISSGAVIRPTVATAVAASGLPFEDPLVPTESPELLASELGWVWLVRCGNGGGFPSHLVPVHGDGAIIPAQLISQLKLEIQPEFDGLSVISSPRSDSQAETAKRLYFDFLQRECGSINYEGLPADEGIGGNQIKLNRIYVPLTFQESSTWNHSTPLAMTSTRKTSERYLKNEDVQERRTIDLPQLLRRHERSAILGPPGAGKTTILKRIALGYAADDHRKVGDEVLPDMDVLPLFIRCRQLEGMAGAPIMDVLNSIPSHAGISDMQGAFSSLILDSVRSGRALLLIDGLDEIADEQARMRFCGALRTFLAMYPGVRMIVTSRHSGFRLVASAIAGGCENVDLAPLTYAAVASLCTAWMTQAVDDSQKTKSLADHIAQEIYYSEQLQPLATNPLLLTTLLLVRRWAGEVPKKRTLLYDRAVDVLLMTWNVEGHVPLDKEEVIPQLSYIAYRMMQEGHQSISHSRLSNFVVEAREVMPQILGFVRQSPADFVNRVEDRSSLLIMSGHTVEAGRLAKLYEFKHLSFQEYFAALAIAMGYAEANTGTSLSTSVARYSDDESWRETLAMTVVLAGMQAITGLRPILDHLQGRTSVQRNRFRDDTVERHLYLLISALADEAMLSPVDAREVSQEVTRWYRTRGFFRPTLSGVAASKFSDLFQNEVERQFIQARSVGQIQEAADVAAGWMLWKLRHLIRFQGTEDAMKLLKSWLQSQEESKRCLAALGVMVLSYSLDHGPTRMATATPAALTEFAPLLVDLVRGKAVKEVFVGCWALAWVSNLSQWKLRSKTFVDVSIVLSEAWMRKLKGGLRRYAAWAFLWLPMSRRPVIHNRELPSEVAEKAYILSRKFPENVRGVSAEVPLASLVCAYYWNLDWAEPELRHYLPKFHPRVGDIQLRMLSRSLDVRFDNPELGGASKGRPASRAHRRR